MKIKKNYKPRFSWILFAFISTYPLNAQESFPGLDNLTPPSPNASAIVQGANIPVSYYTGIPSVQIPLWEMKGRKLTLPIELLYHCGGIKVGQISGWVGLGWSLSAGGVISRTIRGRADDLSGGYLTSHGHGLPKLTSDPNVLGTWKIPGIQADQDYYMLMVANGSWDTEPDIFAYSFNGRSGKFFFDVDGKVVMLSKENLLIKPLLSPNGKIDAWEVVDESGTVYKFGTPEATEMTAPLTEFGAIGELAGSSWYLKSIASSNGEDQFDFNYSDFQQTIRYPLPQKKISGQYPKWDDLYLYKNQFIDGKILTTIEGPGEVLDFNTVSYGDYIGGKILALTLLDIHTPNGQPAKSFRFDYSFFPGSGCGTIQDFLPPCRRLRLDKVTEKAVSGTQSKPPYMFMYDETPLPPRGSFSQDYWGYYNGAVNEFFIPAVRIRNYSSYSDILPGSSHNPLPFDILTQVNINLTGLKANEWEIPGANRDPDPIKMQAGILKRIIYPNGGSTRFEYEPNDFGFFSYHPMPKQNITESLASSGNKLPVQTKSNLHIQEGQEITLIPLFYVLKGSHKDSTDAKPGLNSAIYVLSSQMIDRDPDTLFKYTFNDLKLEGGLDVKKLMWLPAGEYQVLTSAEEMGDIVKLITKFEPESFTDKTYRIFSRKFEKISVQAGNRYFPDDSSFYMTKEFEIDSLDDLLVQIEFQFRSKIHPNRISTVGLPFPITSVRLSAIENPSKHLYEKIYLGDSLISWDKLAEEWYYKGTKQVHLNPGHYRLEFLPRISSETGYIKVIISHVTEIQNRQIGGGVRIKKILDLDNASDTLGVTNFTYQIKDGNSFRSSGVLSGFPLYYDLPEENYYLGSSAVPENDYAMVNLYSNGKSSLGSTSGVQIGYSQVEVQKKGNGKTVYCFTSAIEYPDQSSLLFPYPPAVSFDWKRGLLKEKYLYSEKGFLRSYEKMDYNELKDSVNHNLIPAIKIIHKAPGNNLQNVYRKFIIEGGWNTLNLKTVVTYDPEGKHPVEKTVRYRYSSKHLQLIRSETMNSDSATKVTNYLYPDDVVAQNIPGSAYLKTKHMVNTVLKKETFLDSVRVSGQKINYKLFNDDQVLPASVDVLEGDHYQTKLFYDQYDHKGNLLQYHRPGDRFHAINWDEEKKFPVAEVENANYHSKINEYPANAIISKFSYHPFWGLSSQTDPNQMTTYYIYDVFGRLTQVKNSDQEILSTNAYHLKHYKGDTTRAGFQITPITFSFAPTGIQTSNDTLPFTCDVTMNVEGGKLGSKAKWVWYADQCAGTKLGEGISLNVTPSHSTYYFVRAEGVANNTACASIHIIVVDPEINPSPSSLHFPEEGSGHIPFSMSLNYSGCDAFQVSKDVEWFTVEKDPDGMISVSCEVNPFENGRSGNIIIQVNYLEITIPVYQEGAVPLALLLNYSPALVSPGTLVKCNAELGNGSGPYDFSWEIQNSGESVWNEIRRIQDRTSPLDQVTIEAPETDFYIRCTAGPVGKKLSKTLLIRVLQ